MSMPGLALAVRHSSINPYLKWLVVGSSIRNRAAHAMLQQFSKRRSFADDDLTVRSGAREFFE